MNEKNIKFKIFIKYALAFFFAFFLFCSVSFAVIGVAVSPDYAIFQVKKSDYIDLSIEEIEEGLISVAIPGGLPEDFFSYGITDKTFHDNMEEFIKTVYKNEPYIATDNAFREEITEKIYAFAEERLPEFDEDIKEQIDTLVSLCCERYMRYVTPKVLQYVGNYCGRLSIPAFVVSLVTLSLAAVSFLFIHRMDASKKVYRISFLSSALLIGALPLSMLLFAGIDKIGITSKALFALISSFIKTPLYIMLILAIIIILAVVLEIVISKKKSLH